MMINPNNRSVTLESIIDIFSLVRHKRVLSISGHIGKIIKITFDDGTQISFEGDIKVRSDSSIQLE